MSVKAVVREQLSLRLRHKNPGGPKLIMSKTRAQFMGKGGMYNMIKRRQDCSKENVAGREME